MKKLQPKDVINQQLFLNTNCVSLYASTPKDFEKILSEAEEFANKKISERQRRFLFNGIKEEMNAQKIKLKFPIGVFLSEMLYGYVKLPFDVEPLSVVAKSFHIKPLLKLVQRDQCFLMLFFSNKQATLFSGSPTDLQVVEKLSYNSLLKF